MTRTSGNTGPGNGDGPGSGIDSGIGNDGDDGNDTTTTKGHIMESQTIQFTLFFDKGYIADPWTPCGM